MDISHNHHFHISPLAVVALIAAAGLFGAVQGGYLKHAFHKEILASLDPATVLTTTDVVLPVQERRAVAPGRQGPVMENVRQK